MDNLSYPTLKADLILCQTQLYELCQGKHDKAIMSIPPRQTDFDMQMSAAFDELKQYRKSGLTPSECAETAQAKSDGRLAVLPGGWLETLKLLTISAICYQNWYNKIISKMRDSKDIQELFFNLPAVQCTINHIKLIRLEQSGLDVNAMTSIDTIVGIMNSPEATQDALKLKEESDNAK